MHILQTLTTFALNSNHEDNFEYYPEQTLHIFPKDVYPNYLEHAVIKNTLHYLQMHVFVSPQLLLTRANVSLLRNE